MTPEERDLISGLFERMRGMGSIDKDREAEDFIARSVRQTPDAAYMMVQTVLVQENALEQAGDRIEELEDRVRELERGQPRAAAQGGGSFLGGIFGGGRGQPEERSGSVPVIGSRNVPPKVIVEAPSPAVLRGVSAARLAKARRPRARRRRISPGRHDDGRRCCRRHAARKHHQRHDGRRQRQGTGVGGNCQARGALHPTR